jgi:hypothetical protein
MPHFYERPHYQAVAHLLTAGDIGARVVSNDTYTGIEVSLVDGSTVVWSNAGDPKGWAWTRVDPGGDMHTGQEVALAVGAAPEDVARYIADYPYAAAPVPTT